MDDVMADEQGGPAVTGQARSVMKPGVVRVVGRVEPRRNQEAGIRNQGGRYFTPRITVDERVIPDANL
ncbi:hypothetical protein HYW29_00900, partial [Candidatus Amesbacteria bacterium]|nr:hypothetical protein [Candidatus Amesbacteria bacterium]